MLANRSRGVVVLKPPARKITIRDLLTHTSGVPSGLPPDMAELYRKRDRTLSEVIPTIAKPAGVRARQPLGVLQPGHRHAGADHRGRFGPALRALLQQQIFTPLGMADTTFYPNERQRRRMAALYDSRQGKLVAVGYQLLGSAENARYPIPAGGLYSTGADLARLYQMMLCGGQFHGIRILTEKSVREMTRVQTGDLAAGFVPGMGFGLGWGVVRQPQGITEMFSPGTFGHGERLGTQGWIDPKQDLFVILLIQRVGLRNSDGSDMRRELQRLAVAAVKGKL